MSRNTAEKRVGVLRFIYQPPAHQMAWGKKPTGDDLAAKLASGSTSLFILPFRSFGEEGECAVSSLDKRNSFAGPPDAVKFAAALGPNTSLLEFYASGKAIGLEGVAAFGTIVREYSLSPVISEEKCLAAEALKVNSTLTSICIGDASMGDEGVSALAAGLVENRGE